jgi:hypothetical protein
MKDALSAEAYCSLGGQVVPTKVAASTAESVGLRDWVEVLFPGQNNKGSSKSSFAHPRVVDDATKSQLLKLLLEVYLADG